MREICHETGLKQKVFFFNQGKGSQKSERVCVGGDQLLETGASEERKGGRESTRERGRERKREGKMTSGQSLIKRKHSECAQEVEIIVKHLPIETTIGTRQICRKTVPDIKISVSSPLSLQKGKEKVENGKQRNRRSISHTYLIKIVSNQRDNKKEKRKLQSKIPDDPKFKCSINTCYWNTGIH